MPHIERSSIESEEEIKRRIKVNFDNYCFVQAKNDFSF